mmetsp:Transcript_105090/g.302124  ORF Transcript_105090/g.302124 Transcript_105090/m.302124 type:complete len:204 (+) Transcript_105090:35-646(+)
MPQLSCAVSGIELGKIMRMRRLISSNPRLNTAALVFSAKPRPSEKPAASATTLFKPPKSSTPNTSCVVRTLKLSELKRLASKLALLSSEQPSVASAKFPEAMSSATFAPFSTAHLLRRKRSAMTWVPVFKCLPPSVTTRCPLINETAIVPGATEFEMVSNNLCRNWCGNTNIRTCAPFTASTASGTATKLSGNAQPFKYFTFS